MKSVTISLSLVSLVGITSACSSSPSSDSSAGPTSAATTGAGVADAAIGSNSVNYQVPDSVVTEYFQAICEGSTTKLGMGGKFDTASSSCTDGMGAVTTKASVVSSLLGSTPDQMIHSIQMMVAQVGAPVTDCPTSQDFNTITDLTITDSCVENALIAMTKFMNS